MFTTVSLSEHILYQCFSFASKTHEDGTTEYEGSLIELVHVLLSRKASIRDLITREDLPDLSHLLGTIVLVAFTVYLNTHFLKVSCDSEKVKEAYKISIVYGGIALISMQDNAFSIINYLCYVFYHYFPNSALARLLGIWEVDPTGFYNGPTPVSGLAYYFSPPASPAHMVSDPIQVIVYTAVTLIITVHLAHSLPFSASLTPVELAQTLLPDITADAKDESSKKLLDQLTHSVHLASTLCGILAGFVTVVGNLIGCYDSGTNIFYVACGLYLVYNYHLFEDKPEEKQKSS